MICPRCGRPLSENANFCGGCGLSRREIERYARQNPGYGQAPRANDRSYPQNDFPARENGDRMNAEPNTQSDFSAGETGGTAYPQSDIPTREDYTQPGETTNEGGVYYGADGSVKNEGDNLFNGGNDYASESAKYSYTQSSYSYNAPKNPMYQAGRTTYRPYERDYDETPRGEAPLSTADFIWMILISGIPVVGFIYMLYLAFFQSGRVSVNKRSYARAILIITRFSALLAFVFMIGLIFSFMTA